MGKVRITFLHFLLLIICFAAFSCTQHHGQSELAKIDIQQLAHEVQIPGKVMSNIENEINGDTKGISPVYVFLPLSVRFDEIQDSVLSRAHIQYNFPKGGGELDLKDLVTGFGSFYMSFPAEQFNKKPALMHIYYVSDSPIKKIDGDNFGLGCGRFVDLKKSFSKLQQEDFLKLNTSDLRYLYVTAGRYIFVFRQASQVYITQLTITDSRYKNELCLGANNE